MYGDSPALSSVSTPIFPSNSNPKRGVALTEHQDFFMGSDSNTNYTEFRQQFLSGNQNNPGLQRYRSAPTSLLSNFAQKSENLSSRFCSDEANSVHLLGNDENSGNNKGAVGASRFCGMNSELPPQYPRQNGGQMGYKVVGSTGSSIMRQHSSPAGMFSHLTSQNGIGSYKMVEHGANGGDLSPSSIRFKNRMNFSSGIPSMLSRIAEVENENGVANGLDEAKVENGNGDDLFSASGFPFSSWNDSSNFAENFSSSGIKREMDNDHNLFVHNQNGEVGNRPHMLSHHLSLPKTSAEISAMDKLFQLQDTVPCKIRAKRGCATHPRSIAERVRRTRISERMRKLQELVPNMDKQTSTADMLDLAVEYIKSLQKQYKTLNDLSANCKCSASQKVVNLNQTN